MFVCVYMCACETVCACVFVRTFGLLHTRVRAHTHICNLSLDDTTVVQENKRKNLLTFQHRGVSWDIQKVGMYLKAIQYYFTANYDS